MFDIKDVELKLNKMLLYKQDAKCVHSLFCSDYPVGLGEGNKIVIYDVVNGIYKYDQTVTVLMTIPESPLLQTREIATPLITGRVD